MSSLNLQNSSSGCSKVHWGGCFEFAEASFKGWGWPSYLLVFAVGSVMKKKYKPWRNYSIQQQLRVLPLSTNLIKVGLYCMAFFTPIALRTGRLYLYPDGAQNIGSHFKWCLVSAKIDALMDQTLSILTLSSFLLLEIHLCHLCCDS